MHSFGSVAESVPDPSWLSRALVSPTCSRMICSHSPSRSFPIGVNDEGCSMNTAGRRVCSSSSVESGGYASRSSSSAKLSQSSAQISGGGPEFDQVPPFSTFWSSNDISPAVSPKCRRMVCSHSTSREGVTRSKACGWKRKIAGGRAPGVGSEDASGMYSVMINSARGYGARPATDSTDAPQPTTRRAVFAGSATTLAGNLGCGGGRRSLQGGWVWACDQSHDREVQSGVVRRKPLERLGSCGCRNTDATDWSAHDIEMLSMGLVDVSIPAFLGLKPSQGIGPDGKADIHATIGVGRPV